MNDFVESGKAQRLCRDVLGLNSSILAAAVTDEMGDQVAAARTESNLLWEGMKLLTGRIRKSL